MSKAPPPPAPGVWMLTASYNDHDQHGPVPCCIWPTKPTMEQLAEYFQYTTAQQASFMAAVVFLMRLLDGGGRDGNENQWYELDFVPFGKNLERDDT